MRTPFPPTTLEPPTIHSHNNNQQPNQTNPNPKPENPQNHNKGLIGCTQDTEILYIEGVDLIADLPKEFELATVYTAAVCSKAKEPKGAADLIALLAGSETATLRIECGFEG